MDNYTEDLEQIIEAALAHIRELKDLVGVLILMQRDALIEELRGEDDTAH